MYVKIDYEVEIFQKDFEFIDNKLVVATREVGVIHSAESGINEQPQDEIWTIQNGLISDYVGCWKSQKCCSAFLLTEKRIDLYFAFLPTKIYFLFLSSSMLSRFWVKQLR